MKVAVIYNRESTKVINMFGVPNRERIGMATIRRIGEALKRGGHQVINLEGDKDLIDRLEEFMPRVLKGERPGMAFNISYGIQGQARYTHVPSILEMVGIPYIGSGPLAHSLALDKVVSKILFQQHGLPTPEFVVIDDPGFTAPELNYPLITKPKNEAVSFGLRIVNDEAELREAANEIFDTFKQPVLIERYIDGREINVGLLGNNLPEPFIPAELIFGEGGPSIYTYEDKTHNSNREVSVVCPAPISGEITLQAQKLAIRAFTALGCYDCGRVDMRLDSDGNLYILEMNSLPSLGPRGSYVAAAECMGLDFSALINRLVEIASARYFGTPQPMSVSKSSHDRPAAVFSYVTSRRDRIEQQLQRWVGVSSRTDDPIGLQLAATKLDETLQKLGLTPVTDISDERYVWSWQTSAGFHEGVLLIGHLDVPVSTGLSAEPFHKDPEWLYGEGAGSSRAPLVMLEYALRALRSAHRLDRIPLGILYYTDEGLDCRYSGEIITQAFTQAKTVLILRPGSLNDRVVTSRRGQSKYRLVVTGTPRRLGQLKKKPELTSWLFSKLDAISKLSSRKDRIAVSAVDVRTEAYPLLLPHRSLVILLLSYPDERWRGRLEDSMREILGTDGLSWELNLVSNRPPMKERRVNISVLRRFEETAAAWEIPLDKESSLWPSVAGLAPPTTGVICGLGPVTRDLYTAREAVQRASLVQRTLLLAQFLLHTDS